MRTGFMSSEASSRLATCGKAGSRRSAVAYPSRGPGALGHGRPHSVTAKARPRAPPAHRRAPRGRGDKYPVHQAAVGKDLPRAEPHLDKLVHRILNVKVDPRVLVVVPHDPPKVLLHLAV